MEKKETSMDYYIDDSRKYKVAEIAQLFATYYDESYNIIDPNYLSWQYLNNPNGNAIVAQARSTKDNSLVGVYILNPIELNQYGKSTLSLNTFTHADYRGKGMFTILAKDCYQRAAKSGVKSIIGFPNPMSYGGFIKKLKFTDVGNVKYMIKVINPLKSIVEAVTGSSATKQLLFKGNINKIKDIRNDFVKDFMNEWNAKNSLTVNRSVEYYHWRYQQHPINKYHILAHKVDNKVEALMVVKKNVKRLSELLILDFMWLNIESANFLFKNLQKDIKKDISVVRVYSNPLHSDHLIYKAMGFFDSNKLRKRKLSVPLIYRALIDSLPEPNFSDWRVSLGDGDME